MRVNLGFAGTAASSSWCGGALWSNLDGKIHQSGGLRLKSMPAAFSMLFF
jgi:hypothetical protein